MAYMETRGAKRRKLLKIRDAIERESVQERWRRTIYPTVLKSLSEVPRRNQATTMLLFESCSYHAMHSIRAQSFQICAKSWER